MIRLLILLILPVHLLAQEDPGIESQDRLEQLVERVEKEELEAGLNIVG